MLFFLLLFIFIIIICGFIFSDITKNIIFFLHSIYGQNLKKNHIVSPARAGGVPPLPSLAGGAARLHLHHAVAPRQQAGPGESSGHQDLLPDPGRRHALWVFFSVFFQVFFLLYFFSCVQFIFAGVTPGLSTRRWLASRTVGVFFSICLLFNFVLLMRFLDTVSFLFSVYLFFLSRFLNHSL